MKMIELEIIVPSQLVTQLSIEDEKEIKKRLENYVNSRSIDELKLGEKFSLPYGQKIYYLEVTTVLTLDDKIIVKAILTNIKN